MADETIRSTIWRDMKNAFSLQRPGSSLCNAQARSYKHLPHPGFLLKIRQMCYS